MLSSSAEIWCVCFGFCSVFTLRQLSLVCRYFCTLCRPLLSRRQSISAPHAVVSRHNWLKLTMDLHNKAEALNELATSPLAAFVREWHFTSDRSLDLQPRHPLIVNIHVLQDTWLRLNTIFTTTLGAYRRLTVLDLAHLTIDAEIRTVFESLEALKELSLSDCDIVSRTGTPLPLKKIQSVRFHVVAPHNLQRLTVSALLDAQALFVTLVHRPLPHLTHLSIVLTTRISDLFFVVLDSCARLERIEIRSVNLFGRIGDLSELCPDQLPPATLPVLNRFEGVFSLVGRFVHNRPVNDVRLARSPLEMTAEEVLSTLATISQSSVTLRSLSIGPALPPAASPEISMSILRAALPFLGQILVGTMSTITSAFTEMSYGNYVPQLPPIPAIHLRLYLH
ncbi:hypothetical protein DFH07DRAFT_1067874 [Mycena maculata]|uniref:F-box domain-containing protein n=1 Tax=Mycena maculata TaxID=230809 RepID=A0AAD7HFN0_9AGAR|nr:hypothetical protein DFH07DRAFT_1067874 [Mycena maculata]